MSNLDLSYMTEPSMIRGQNNMKERSRELEIHSSKTHGDSRPYIWSHHGNLSPRVYQLTIKSC